MATFILIHGSWHWGGCFVKVANILGRQWPRRHHAGSRQPRLRSDADPCGPPTCRPMPRPVRAALEQVKGKAILVGHSVGGATCTWLGEELPAKIAALVYLTGFMAPAGKTARDFVMTPTYLKDPAIVESQGMLRLGKEGLGLDLSKHELIARSLFSGCTAHDIKVALANLVRVTPHAPFTAISPITRRALRQAAAALYRVPGGSRPAACRAARNAGGGARRHGASIEDRPLAFPQRARQGGGDIDGDRVTRRTLLKVIGLIGGMSWESSAHYYRIINQETRERLGGVHSARSLMWSVDFGEIERLQHDGQWDALTLEMIDAARRLERGGADFIVLCTNTMHRMAERH